MSFHCSNMVWERDFGTPHRKVIAARLADHADSNGCGIWPSVERIAAECCLSVRTVQRVLKDFVKEGLLVIVAEGGKGPGSPRHYDFDMTVLAKLPLVNWGKKARETPVKNNEKHKPLKGDNQSPIDPAKGVSVSTMGDSVSQDGCQGVTQTINELSDKPPKGGVVARASKNGCETGVSQGKDPSSISLSQSELETRENRIREAMNIGSDDHLWKADFCLLIQWETAGYDFELDVLPTIASVSRNKTERPNSLGYFSKPIARHNQLRLAPPEIKANSPMTKPFRYELEQKATIDAALEKVFGPEEN
ncbi:hypothetical protein LP7551_03898 [Roseibium album]|nr:hypothetical protein LP7551_03898 [Roseibium album]